MKVSVVIPVHNKAPWLQTCLDSVFVQSYSDFEVIAVDDASSDESASILAAIRDPRLRVIRLDRNVGPGSAAQCGMDQARGTYILRVDADDIQLPDRFAAQVAFLDSHPKVGALGTAMQLMGDGDPFRYKPLDDAACRVELLFGVALHQPSMALRRSVLLEHGIRYAKDWPWVGEDRMFQIELARVTELANLDQVLVRYRHFGQGISQTGRDRWEASAEMNAHALVSFGFPEPDQDQLELHAYAVKRFKRVPNAIRLKACKAWLMHLANYNRMTRRLDQNVLEERSRRAWNELLHHMPQFGKRVTWEYIRLGTQLTPARLYYLVRVFMRPQGPARWVHR